jgi:TatA/E family protein of Tat protein translocase
VWCRHGRRLEQAAMLPSIGMMELVVILVIALIIFGPRKLPELGKSLGKSIGEFRKASNELKSTLEDEIRVEEQREQRAKLAEEQKTAVEGAEAHVPPAVEPTSPMVESVPEEPTVSRTTGTQA